MSICLKLKWFKGKFEQGKWRRVASSPLFLATNGADVTGQDADKLRPVADHRGSSLYLLLPLSAAATRKTFACIFSEVSDAPQGIIRARGARGWCKVRWGLTWVRVERAHDPDNWRKIFITYPTPPPFCLLFPTPAMSMTLSQVVVQMPP